MLLGGIALGLLALPAMSAAAALPIGSATHGQQLFARCATCHTIGAGPGSTIGPNLNGVVGRKAGTVAAYRYSPAMQNSGLTWDAATLSRFLEAPMKVVPGTRMFFPGLATMQDRSDIVIYLKQFRTNGTSK